MENLLIATDFSDNAFNALQYGLEIALKTKAKLHVIAVAHVIRSGAGRLRSIDHIVEEDVRNSMHRLQKDIEKLEIYNQVSITFITLKGETADVVIDYANKIKADITFIGAKGITNFEALVIGSVALNILHKSKLPVMVVPGNAFFSGFSKIGIGVDLQPLNYQQAYTGISNLASHYASEIALFHMLDARKEISDNQLDEAQKIKHFWKEHKTELFLRSGTDIVQILDYFAIEHQVNLLVLVSRKYKLIQSLFHKSITNQMAKHAKLPFLAIKE